MFKNNKVSFNKLSYKWSVVLKKIKFLIFVLVVGFESVASQVTSGIIVEIRGGPWYGDIVLIKTNPQPVTEGCSNLGDKGHYLIGTSKVGGTNTLSLLLSAKATGREVQVWGTNSCVTFNGNHRGEELETIAYK